jgi:hypothetical protein
MRRTLNIVLAPQGINACAWFTYVSGKKREI